MMKFFDDLYCFFSSGGFSAVDETHPLIPLIKTLCSSNN